MDQIHKDMTIEEIFTRFPQKSQKLAQELTSSGLHCVGCGAATWETLEAGMLGHDFSESAIEEMIHRLNSILEEKIDATTISMTKRAAEKFKDVAKQEGKAGWALRFGDKPGGCGGFEYILDFSEKPDEKKDKVFHSHGVDIHIDLSMVERLLGVEVDYSDALNGSGFKITNPNAKSSCGCGNSQNY